MVRPTAVTVLGWVSVGAGILSVLSSVFAFLAFGAVRNMSEGREISGEMPPGTAAIFGLFQYFPYLVALQLILGAVLIFTGRAFLECRPWARTVLEIFAWVGMAYTVVFGSYWMWSAWSLSSQASDASPIPGSFRFVFLGMGGVIIAVWVVLLGLVIRSLRSTVVRSAMRPQASSIA